MKELIIFIGIQGSGKTTFYKENFFKSHLRISLDQLKNRDAEKIILKACLKARQSIVIDNTNISKFDRKKYIKLAEKNKFRVIGYYFASDANSCIKRNNKRTGRENVDNAVILGYHNSLEVPQKDEGYCSLYRIEIKKNKFVIAQL